MSYKATYSSYLLQEVGKLGSALIIQMIVTSVWKKEEEKTVLNRLKRVQGKTMWYF